MKTFIVQSEKCIVCHHNYIIRHNWSKWMISYLYKWMVICTLLFKSLGSVWMVLKEVTSDHQCCIYLIKNNKSKVKMWNIITIEMTVFYVNIIKCNLFLWSNLISIITPGFSVTWSFRNHTNMLICCSRNVFDYYLIIFGNYDAFFQDYLMNRKVFFVNLCKFKLQFNFMWLWPIIFLYKYP